ncbi:MAG: hypothetical protein MUO26_01895 [Methanotrichaceae archaeon]|nr:hypothetical protein [Methanotrichaceae archaeon]
MKRKALLYKKLADKKVRCNVCQRKCFINDGETGWCQTRLNDKGDLYTLNYGEISSISINPIEKKPVLWLKYRSEPPIIMASTLIVPGYIEEQEVRSIAKFIATIDPQIPYSRLAFYPHFYMQNLPLIEKSLARRCLAEAHDAGLDKVRLGNKQLLI